MPTIPTAAHDRRRFRVTKTTASVLALALLGGCGEVSDPPLSAELREALVAASGGRGLDAWRLPASDDLDAIPQDPANPLTPAKVALGQMLFHDTAFATAGRAGERESRSWSCATCHHAGAGFKSGLPQGIAEGGVGFGADGTARRLAPGFDGAAEPDAADRPDIQPLASPTILNAAYQDVMLWNGQFGNAAGSVNAAVPASALLTPGTPKIANAYALPGLETQAIAGIAVHRLRVDAGSELQSNPAYVELWNAAYPDGSEDVVRDAGKAIAAWERTVLADRAPFQRWLAGDDGALDRQELAGALVFFGPGGCADCHRGPALSSEPGASEEETFFAVGFDDLDPGDLRVHGDVDEATRRGRGGLTGERSDDFRFKVPTLYNLADSDVFGHGASFDSIGEVIAYKNAGRAQNAAAAPFVDERLRPLHLTAVELEDLERFLTSALRDPELSRHAPRVVPSGRCVVVDAHESLVDPRCPSDGESP